MEGRIMLRAKARLKITTREKSCSDDIRPMIEVGGSFLFSGSIKSPEKEYVPNRPYDVIIEFDNIEWIVYRSIKSMLAAGKSVSIREGNKVIGEAKIFECGYEI